MWCGDISRERSYNMGDDSRDRDKSAIPKCKICSENVERRSFKCANIDCHVYVHKKCFELCSKVFFIEKEWICRSCTETKNKSEVNTEHSHVLTSNNENDILRKEIDCLIREKDLLIKLTTEREYIIELQKKRITDLECKEFTSEFFQARNNNVHSVEQKNFRSYSSVAKTNHLDNSKTCLIIKSADRKVPNTSVERYFKNNFSPGSLGVELNRTKVTKDGFLVSCANESEMKKLKETLETKISNDYQICEPARLRPKIIIRGIPEECLKEQNGANKLLLSDNFIQNLIDNNNLVPNSVNDFHVISCFKSKSSINVILEIVPSLFKLIINRGFIFLGWQKCFVKEYYHLIRCFKCNKFGHLKKDCKNEKSICPDCSECHERKDCKSKSKLCPNCIFQNSKYKSNWPTDHSAISYNCNFYKMKIDNLKSKIQYE